MARFSWPVLTAAGGLAALAGCSGFDTRERPAWRDRAEEACLAQGFPRASPAVTPFREIDGPGICGLRHPFKVRGLAGGSVALSSTETLDCDMIPALDAWVSDHVQPATLARFGEPVAEIRTMRAYNCRGINNEAGGTLSEHAFGNAIDIGGFVLRSGREINVMRQWRGGDAQEQAFLREAQAGACGLFTTTLAPGSNVFHYNHIHLDLAQHGWRGGQPRRLCKPALPASVPAPAVMGDSLAQTTQAD